MRGGHRFWSGTGVRPIFPSAFATETCDNGQIMNPPTLGIFICENGAIIAPSKDCGEDQT